MTVSLEPFKVARTYSKIAENAAETLLVRGSMPQPPRKNCDRFSKRRETKPKPKAQVCPSLPLPGIIFTLCPRDLPPLSDGNSHPDRANPSHKSFPNSIPVLMNMGLINKG